MAPDTKIMNINRNASIISREGSSDYFTGGVRVESLISTPEPARLVAAQVTFAPGARTAWHTHPLGQTLIIVSGVGWVQREGSEREVVLPGDVVWFSPGERHWHGATDNRAMTHLALQEALDGQTVEWREQVTDAEYLAG